MLLSYCFENFGPFKERVEFSMRPGQSMARYADNEVEFDNKIRVLKSAVIVGENGGGKTTFIRSLKRLQSLIGTANKLLVASKDTMNANLSNIPDAEQKYELEVLLCVSENGGKQGYYIYNYILNLDRHGIVREYLKRCPVGKRSEDIFDIKTVETEIDVQRHTISRGMKAELNKKFFDQSELLKQSLVDYRMGTALNRLAGFCPEVISPFIDWIENSLVVKCPLFADFSLYANETEQTLDILASPQFLELFRLVDPTIVGIKVDEKEPYKETRIIRMTENREEFSMALINESTGIREFFCWAEQIWKVLAENKTLFSDEVDRVLNPVLAAKLIAYINKSDHKGQFIFTTHNALHLNFQDFRKEQMWIVSKNSTPLSSDMYSIADFGGVRYDNNHLYKDYLNGFFGGIGNA